MISLRTRIAERQDGREDADRIVPEVGSGLRAGAGCADGVGNRVQGEDRGQRSIDIALELAKAGRHVGLSASSAPM